MHYGAQCLLINRHQYSQTITAFATKACVLATKSGMFNFCEACAAICCESNLWKLRTQYTESIFCPSEKKTKTKELFYDNDFRKVFVYNSTPDALHDLDTSERKRPRNRTYDGCLWKPAKHNKVRTSKQLRLVASTETFKFKSGLRIRVKKTHVAWFSMQE